MVLFEVVLLFVGLLIILYRRSMEKWTPLDKIPGPKGLPVLGNILDMDPDNKRSLEKMMSFAQEYSSAGMYKLQLGPTVQMVVLTHPKYMEQILSSSVHLYKGGFYKMFKNWLGNGLVTANGNKWKHSRRILSPVFNTKMLEGFHEQFFQQNLKFVNELQRMEGRPFDISKLIERNSFNHMFTTLIDQDVDEKMTEDFLRVSKVPMHITHARLNSIKIIDFIFKLTKDSKIERKAIADIQSIISQIITKKRTNQVDPVMAKNTFLDVLLKLQRENSDIPDLEVIQQLNTFMFAGHDTTAVSTNFGIYELCCNRNIQERLLQESNGIFGTDLSTELTLKELESADYLDRFCKETLRKYPVAPLIARTTTEELKLDHLDIPIGTTIAMLIYAIHRNERYYPEPLNFDPDRFLSENKANRPECSFIPFSYGPRNCIGSRFAMIEMKTTICTLVRNFVFSKGDPNFTVSIGHAGTLMAINGIYVRITKRQ